MSQQDFAPKPLLILLMLVALTPALLGCVSHPTSYGTYAAHLNPGDSPWKLMPAGDAGHLSLTFALSENDRVLVRLLDRRVDVLADVLLYDDDCAFGHEARVQFPGGDSGIWLTGTRGLRA